MSSHDLIFSNRPAYRISRHVMFWVFWLVFGYSITWLPNNSKEFMPFFSNWNYHELLQRIYKQQGGWLNSFYNPFRNYWWKYFLGHIVFTYTILYLVLPGYFSGKMNKIFLTIITLLLLAIYITWHYITTSINFADMVEQGFPEKKQGIIVFRPIMPDHWYILATIAKSTLFELPIVAGLAITIKLLKRWWLQQKEAEELARGKARAELQLLKAQIHPHFLFNTLNNIYFFTLSASKQAPEMIKKLSDMLRYMLNECDRPAVPLEKELKLIQDYMALEKIRYGEQMNMTIELKGNYHNKMVTPLLLIPFIENSFKHGASKMLTHPYVKLSISIEDNHLLFLLTNNKPDMATPVSRNGSIGLKNVRKRLQLLYPGTHELNIVNEPESFIVFLKIQLQEAKPITTTEEEIQVQKYELV
ncbi:sensor histidine kinase [Ginsengibacter hankyongi]|nr:histidine kinase [Ginsengibacter hankyongi]